VVSDSDRIDFSQLQFILLHQMVEKLSRPDHLQSPSQLRVFVFQVIERVGQVVWGTALGSLEKCQADKSGQFVGQERKC